MASRYDDVKVVEFGCGTAEEIDLLARMDIPTGLAYVVLDHNNQRLYTITHWGKKELTGIEKRLIRGGMFPGFTGVIKPDFKMIRVDVPTILAAIAKENP